MLYTQQKLNIYMNEINLRLKDEFLEINWNCFMKLFICCLFNISLYPGFDLCSRSSIHLVPSNLIYQWEIGVRNPSSCLIRFNGIIIKTKTNKTTIKDCFIYTLILVFVFNVLIAYRGVQVVQKWLVLCKRNKTNCKTKTCHQ